MYVVQILLSVQFTGQRMCKTDNNDTKCPNSYQNAKTSSKIAWANEIPCPISIHYGALAWGSGFYVGVHKALEERWGGDFSRLLESVHGDSAGVLFALGIALGKSAEYMDKLYRSLSKEAHAVGMNIVWENSRVINAALDLMLDDENAFEKVQNRLSIGVTEFPLKHVRYSQYKSNEELRRLAHASMYLPLYCEPVGLVNGRWVVDGGFSFTGGHLSHGNETLFVGIDAAAEISGAMSLKEMAFPMVDHRYEAAVEMGFNALMKWDGVMKDKIKHRKINWGGLVMWPLMILSMIINSLMSIIRVVFKLLVCVATIECRCSSFLREVEKQDGPQDPLWREYEPYHVLLTTYEPNLN